MRIKAFTLTVLLAFPLTACSQEAPSNTAASTTSAAETKISEAKTSEAKTLLKVYKSPTCSCCGAWIDQIKAAGFDIAVDHPEDLYALKKDLGIAGPYQSCHTAVSESGFVFEGHVPRKFVSQFLAAPPSGAAGLSVPGMPVGSPGMEVEDRFMPYQVLQLNKDGTTSVFAEVKSPEDQR